MARRVQIVVTYFNYQIMYYPVPVGQGWKVSTSDRHISVGTGLPRTRIPLDNVASYSIETFEDSNGDG